MYERFYGLRERPFSLTPDPRYVVLTDAHREAITNIEYGIAGRHGITLLIGQAGSGKTTVIRYAIERQPPTVHCVHLRNPALTRTEFIEMLAATFDLSARASTSKTALLLELEAVLRARHEANESSVLIVDEAQSLPIDLLEEIRLLANIETNDTKLLSVVLAGQPELAERLEDPSLRQLKQRVALRCELRALTYAETSNYLASRIHSAGGVPGQAFSLEAVMRIHDVSGGVPRTINVLADNALLNGLAANQRPVTRRIVEEVCRDFLLKPSEPVALPAVQHAAAEPLSSVAHSTPASTSGAQAHEPDQPMFASMNTPRRFSLSFWKGGR